MIPITDANLYERSLLALRQFAGRSYRGRLVQIFLAAKFHGAGFPRIGQGLGVNVGDLQYLLDDFYWKASPAQAGRHVAIIFAGNHLVPTGRVDGALQTPSNIWRNNLGLQKAQICYATEAELSDPTFLDLPRRQCPHLRPVAPGALEGARCAMNAGPSYRGEDGPKSLRRDPVDDGFSIVPPENTNFWGPILRRDGRRIPVVPLIVALYFDNPLSAGRAEIEITDFTRDFGFSGHEFAEYFDDDPGNEHHVDIARDYQFAWERAPEAGPVAGGVGAPPAPRNRVERPVIDIDSLPDLVPRTEPPAGSHWWSAEQAVRAYLEASGWQVKDRSRQPVGFDLEARRGASAARYIEVKSSVGPCSPVLTKNEFEAATRYGDRYILAVVERFDPDGAAAILWVRNPASLALRPREVTQYPIPRSIWLKRANTSIN